MISRSQMKRQLYMGGGITQLPVNEMMVPRGQYGLGSIVKSVGKAVKGAVKGVKDIVSSDVGKLALLAAGGYYLGGGNLFGLQRAGMTGFSFGNLPGATMLKNVAAGAGFNVPASTELMPTAYKFGKALSGKTGLAALGIGGASVLAGLFGSPEKAAEMYAQSPEKVQSYLAQYYKNINKNATEQEVQQFVESQTSGLAAGQYGSFATGGRVGLAMGAMPMGEPRENPQGIMELDYRDTGGFVPVGIKEKADDVPAMLSKNEFVFTADAVRGAGNGDVEKGAERLYNTMKTLENGGTV